jgi:excisionase family DNA binding protein
MQPKQQTTNKSPANNAAQSTMVHAGKPFTKRELSNFLGISQRFIEMEVNRGRLRAVKLSNRLLRFRPIDVERWMESSLTNPDE